MAHLFSVKRGGGGGPDDAVRDEKGREHFHITLLHVTSNNYYALSFPMRMSPC